MSSIFFTCVSGIVVDEIITNTSALCAYFVFVFFCFFFFAQNDTSETIGAIVIFYALKTVYIRLSSTICRYTGKAYCAYKVYTLRNILVCFESIYVFISTNLLKSCLDHSKYNCLTSVPR